MSADIAITNKETEDSFSAIASSIESYVENIELLKKAEVSDELIKEVMDVFIRIGNTLMTSITKFNKTFKRGEMEKYIQDHTMVTRSIENMSYMDARYVTVPIPSGMIGSYHNALTVIFDILKNSNVMDIIDDACTRFDFIRDAILNNKDISKESAALNDFVNIKIKFIDEYSKKLNNIFTSKPTKEVLFKDVFSCMQELKSSKELCIESEKYLGCVDDLFKKANTLSSLVSDIASISNLKVSRTISLSLSDSAYVIARLCDLFSSTCLNLLSVSHNLTLVFNALYSKVK